LPTSSDFRASVGNLRQDSAFGNLRAEVLALDDDIQTKVRGGAFSFGGRQSDYFGNVDFGPVNGEAHRSQAGNKCDHNKHEAE